MSRMKPVIKAASFVLGTAAAFLSFIGAGSLTASAQEENIPAGVEYVASDVEVTWDDMENQDGIRPQFLNVSLTVDGESIDLATLSGENNWRGSFGEQPRFDDSGRERVFWVSIETTPDDSAYSFSEPAVSFDGGYHFTITATHETARQDLVGRVVFLDDNNADGIRPDALTLSLYADGEYMDSKTITPADTAGTWAETFPSSSDAGIVTGSEESNAIKNNADTYGQYLADTQNSREISFTGIPANRSGNPITYSIRAESIDGYDIKTVFAKEFGYAFPGAFFAAVHNPLPKTSITVSMAWNDSDNADRIRPAFVHARLIADETDEIASFDLSGSNVWSFTQENINAFSEDGSERTFSLSLDEAPDGYTYAIERNDSENGSVFTITGSHEHTEASAPAAEAAKINAAVYMTWNDSDNADSLRPSCVHASLVADGSEEAASFDLSESNAWTFTVNDIDSANSDGSPRAFSLITDNAPAGYSYSIEKHESEQGIAFTITGTHQPSSRPEDSSGSDPVTPSRKIRLTASIAWDDCDNTDRIRPSSVHGRLLVDDTEEVASFDLSAGNAWSYTAYDVEALKTDGSPRTFSFTTDGPPAGYSYSENRMDTKGGILFTITGRHEHVKEPDPEPVQTSVSGMIIWEDEGNKDQIRPDSVTVYLNGNGQTFNMTASGSTDWKYTFTGIPKYDAQGKVIPYQVTAKEISGYTTAATGYNLISTHEPAKDSSGKTQNPTNSSKETGKKNTSGQAAATDQESSPVSGENASETVSINGRKVWDDQSDKDRIRPTSITIRLYADSKQVKSTTVTADNNWVYSFPDMPKYTSDGKKIKYSIDEDSVSGYTRTVNGYTVVNTHLPADKPGTSGREISGSQASENTGTINISGTKTWVDSNNAEKKRPDYIIVHLFADGIEKRVTTVTESNSWAYSFPNMPKTNESGSPVKYTVDEDDVSGYKKTVTGYNIINTLNSLAGSEEEKEALEKAEKESSQKDSAVQTGDKAPVAIMIAILGSAATVIAGCFIKARRKSGKQKSDDDLIWLE